MHRLFISVVLFFGLSCALLPSVDFNWKPLKTGAGGWVVGLHIHPSGDPFFVRTDVGGAYRFEESTNSWKLVVTTSSISNYTDFIFSYPGVLSLVSAPSNSNRAYMAFSNDVFRSDNKGDTWTRLGLAGLSFDANADYRFQGERFAVSPVNPDIVYFGSQEGLRYSVNAGTSWSMVSLTSFNISGNYAVGNVLFYNQSTIFFTSDNNGVFASYNTGSTWVKLNSGPGAPPNASYYDHITTDSSGALYVAETKLWKYYQGVWTDLNAPVNPAAVAVKPDNSSVIILLYANGGRPYVSSNGGATWTPPSQVTRTATDIPWLAWTSEDWMSVGNIQFHPLRTNELWFSEGIGMWKTSNIFNNTFSWISVNTKIEELVGTDIIVPPGGKPVTAHWDRAVFYHDNVDVYPSTHGPTNRFNSAWDLDYAGKNTTFVVATVADHRFCCTSDGLYIQSGYSTDGGKTWQRFGSLVSGTHPADLWFGNIAVAANDTSSIVWLPSFSAPPYYTTNRGNTWNVITLPNLNGSGNGSHPVYYYNRRVLTADRVRDRTFYLYHTDKGVYRTIDGGISWEIRNNTNLPKGWPAGAYNVVMESVPGYEGHLYWADAFDYGFFKSTDGGNSWIKCNTTTRVNSFGFGKPYSGTYPIVYAQGIASDGTKGLFMSEDSCSSWKVLNPPFPMGIWAFAQSIAGDMSLAGRVHMNFGGAGPVYGDIIPSPSATPTPSVSRTPSSSPSTAVSPSRTPSPSVTPSPSRSPSTAVSPSVTPTRTPSPSPSTAVSPSRTPSSTPSRSPSSSPLQVSPSASLGTSPSRTPSPSQSPSTSPVGPVSPSRTPSTSVSPSTSPTQSATSPSSTPSRSPSSSPSSGTTSKSKEDEGVPLLVVVPAAVGGAVVVAGAVALGFFVKRRRANNINEEDDVEL